MSITAADINSNSIRDEVRQSREEISKPNFIRVVTLKWNLKRSINAKDIQSLVRLFILLRTFFHAVVMLSIRPRTSSTPKCYPNLMGNLK